MTTVWPGVHPLTLDTTCLSNWRSLVENLGNLLFAKNENIKLIVKAFLHLSIHYIKFFQKCAYPHPRKTIHFFSAAFCKIPSRKDGPSRHEMVDTSTHLRHQQQFQMVGIGISFAVFGPRCSLGFCSKKANT